MSRYDLKQVPTPDSIFEALLSETLGNLGQRSNRVSGCPRMGLRL